MDKPPLSFAFSGSGWLLPFHLGVIHELRVANLLTNQTHVSGTSGGALAALVSVCDIDTEELLEKLVVLSETVSKQMRGEGRNGDIGGKGGYTSVDALVRREIASILSPPTASAADMPTETMDSRKLLERLNKNRNLNICVTALMPHTHKMHGKWKVEDKSRDGGGGGLGDTGTPSIPRAKKAGWRGAKLLIVNQFSCVSSLTDAVAASCFIPLYSRVDLSGILSSSEGGQTLARTGTGAESTAESGTWFSSMHAMRIFLVNVYNAAMAARARDRALAGGRLEHTPLGISSAASTSSVPNHDGKRVYGGTAAMAIPGSGAEEHGVQVLDALDGGLLAFLPPVGEVGVSPLGMSEEDQDARAMISAAGAGASASLYYDAMLRACYPAIMGFLFGTGKRSRFPRIHIPAGKYDMKTLLRWVLVPPKRDEMLQLYNDGRFATRKYLSKL